VAEADIEIDPSVYVVEYGSVEHGPAIFVNGEDAEAFNETFNDQPGVQRVTIADATTAAEMIADRTDHEEDDE
jgi:hypothetical protein